MRQQHTKRGRGLRAIAVAALCLTVSFPAFALDSLGVFGSWGAFRDATHGRCYAIAQPVRGAARAAWKPFASVADWPGHGARDQVHIRLRALPRATAAITLSIGERHFTLTGGGADAWAPDARGDAAIVAAMRSGSSMSVETVDARGRPLVDVYQLRGAATAIDAAALACARLR